MATIPLPTVINVTCYFWTGLILALVNLPISYAVLLNKDLRVRYGVMLALFLTCALDGIAGFLKAIYRVIVILTASDYEAIKINAEFCLLNPIILCDIYAFSANAVLLFANSVDRLLVVSMPVKYYVHTKHIVLWELFVTHSITISIFIITVFICAVDSNVTASIECRQPAYFPEDLYMGVACARALLSTMSILTMVIVLLKLRTHGKENVTFVTDRKLATFKSRQQNFTRLTIASSIVTLAFDVIPNCVSAYAHLRNLSDTADYTTYARYGSYLNAVNLALMMSVGLKEIRDEVLIRFRIFNEKLHCFKHTFNIHTISVEPQQQQLQHMNVKGAHGISRQSAPAILPYTTDRALAAIVQPNN